MIFPILLSAVQGHASFLEKGISTITILHLCMEESSNIQQDFFISARMLKTGQDSGARIHVNLHVPSHASDSYGTA
jgi:hypothetical protein